MARKLLLMAFVLNSILTGLAAGGHVFLRHVHAQTPTPYIDGSCCSNVNCNKKVLATSSGDGCTKDGAGNCFGICSRCDGTASKNTCITSTTAKDRCIGSGPNPYYQCGNKVDHPCTTGYIGGEGQTGCCPKRY